MNFLTFFTDDGIPQTGLTPTVRIRDVSDNSLVITDSTSSGVGDGFYKYNFTQYDSTKEYTIRFDGGPSLSGTDRYKFSTNNSFAADIADAVWNEDLTDHDISNSTGHALVYRTFNNRVCIDVNNGQAGTAYPLGLADTPVNNLADAKTIAEVYNIRELYLYSNLVVGATDNINDYIMSAPMDIDTIIILTVGCTTKNTRFHRLIIMGTFDGKSYIETCTTLECFNFSGFIIDTILMDNIAIVDPTVPSLFSACGGGKVSPAIEVDLNNSSLNVGGWKGEAKLVNKDGASTNIIEMMSGQVEIDSTCVSGTIILKGLGRLISDDSGPNCTVDTTDLMNQYIIADETWEHTDGDFLLKVIKNKKILEKAGSIWQLIIYDDDDITPILNKDMLDKDGNNITDLEAGTLAQELADSV